MRRRRWQRSNRCRGRSSRRRLSRCNQTGPGRSPRCCSGRRRRWLLAVDCRRNHRRRNRPTGYRRWEIHRHRWPWSNRCRGRSSRRHLGLCIRFGLHSKDPIRWHRRPHRWPWSNRCRDQSNRRRLSRCNQIGRRSNCQRWPYKHLVHGLRRCRHSRRSRCQPTACSRLGRHQRRC